MTDPPTQKCPQCGRSVEGKPTPQVAVSGVAPGGPLPRVPPARWGFECDCGTGQLSYEWLGDPVN
jgi:hypothetical protein